MSVDGTLNAADVVADFTLPDVATVDSIATSSGTCSSGAGSARCELGDLPGLSQHTVTMQSENDDAEADGGTTNPLLLLLGALAAIVRNRPRNRQTR